MTSKETIQAREAQHHLPSYHHHYYTATPKHSRYSSANDANRFGAERNPVDASEIYTVCTPRLSYGPELNHHGVLNSSFYRKKAHAWRRATVVLGVVVAFTAAVAVVVIVVITRIRHP